MSESNIQGIVGGANAWSSMRIGIAYQEARTVLNAQQAQKQHLDDKALRTAKLVTVVVTGAISLVKILNVAIRPWIALSAGFLLVTAFGFAIASYTTKSVCLGSSERELDQLVYDRYSDDEPSSDTSGAAPWEHGLGVIMGEWISDNQRILAAAKRRLLVSQVTLLFGLVWVVTGIAFGV